MTASGKTPNAKKPVEKESIVVPSDGGHPMSMEELIDGVKKLSGLQQRDNQYDIDVAKTVEWNAVLLNAVVSRVNALEFQIGTHKNLIDTQGSKLNNMDEWAVGVKQDLEWVKGADAQKDWVLRGELSTMAAKLENANAELATKVKQLEAVVVAMPTSLPPPPPPGIGSTSELLSLNVNKLSAAMDDAMSKIGVCDKHVSQLGSRADTLEMNAKFNASSIQEMQGSLTAVRVEVEQLLLQVKPLIELSLSSASPGVAGVSASGAVAVAVTMPW